MVRLPIRAVRNIHLNLGTLTLNIVFHDGVKWLRALFRIDRHLYNQGVPTLQCFTPASLAQHPGFLILGFWSQHYESASAKPALCSS